jgi:SAM-dependent methyltransferase
MGLSGFDAIAADFDCFRALPAEVPAAIRNAVWGAVGSNPVARVLDLGAGTGRIGVAFVSAGDAYVAVDPSARMLAKFAEKARTGGGHAPVLVQADGLMLPFPRASFEAVLMVQVVSGSPVWRRILMEARRVLCPGGCLILGRTIQPRGGLDARMRDRLVGILSEMGIVAGRPGADRDEAFARLAGEAARADRRAVAQWVSKRTPEDFLSRHSTGARFAALPEGVKVQALERLARWAMDVFPSLQTEVWEEHSFEIDIFYY